MARIKLAYIGGGSTRAPGTLASILAQGENFQGSAW
jgi:6-phospho-beta-glucosidase